MNRKEYLLLCLNEECLEVAKEADKALRFGLDDWEPGKPQTETNRKRITEELTDLIAVAQMLKDEMYIDEYMVEENLESKKYRVEYYMSISKKLGIYKDESDNSNE